MRFPANQPLIALSFSELLRMKQTTRRIIVFDPSESLSIFNVIFDFCERDGNKKCKEGTIIKLLKNQRLKCSSLPNFRHVPNYQQKTLSGKNYPHQAVTRLPCSANYSGQMCMISMVFGADGFGSMRSSRARFYRGTDRADRN
jgi:hypothetical protein